MANIFNYDNKLFQAINTILNIIIAGLLWLFTSGVWIPVLLYDISAYVTMEASLPNNSLVITAVSIGSLLTFPMGAATCGLYSSLIKCVKFNKGYISKEFFRAFKNNFKIATPVYGIWFLITAFMVIDIYITRQWLIAGSKMSFMFYTSIFLAGLSLCWFWYLFPYIARFECTKKVAMKNTIIITFANIPWSLLLLAVFIAVCIACVYVQFLIFLVPGFFADLQTIIQEKVFKKYRTEEDIQKEIDDNRDYSDGH